LKETSGGTKMEPETGGGIVNYAFSL
jgi:hypothetical protein